MTGKGKKPGTANFILISVTGIFLAATVATLFTIVIIAVTDFFLFTRPPSIPPRVWRWGTFERAHWTFVKILWGLTFFGMLIGLFGEALKRWGRKKLSGTDREL